MHGHVELSRSDRSVQNLKIEAGDLTKTGDDSWVLSLCLGPRSMAPLFAERERCFGRTREIIRLCSVNANALDRILSRPLMFSAPALAKSLELGIVELALEINFKLSAHGSSEAIEEFPKVAAPQIVLHISRIEMIRDVEDHGPGARLVLWEPGHAKAFGDLDV
jgi:hypothetical protein